MPVAGLQVPGSWHWSAVQTTGFAPTQLPFWQVSVCVQASPSLQGVPLGLFVGAEHMPVAGVQVPGSWHWSAVQTTGFAPAQVPFWQVSVFVQASPSFLFVHLASSESSALSPVAGFPVPGSWHWSAVQTTGLAPTQLPFWQVSVCVQASPSLHGVPSSLAGAAQRSQEPRVGEAGRSRWSADHSKKIAPMELPFWQGAVCVQAVPG